MRTVCLAASGGNPVLREDAAPPKPGPGELLIRVHAAGVISTEPGWYPTTHRNTGEARMLPVLGHEFSGVVEGLGECVGSLEMGRAVFGMNDWFADGAMADYCIAPFFAVAPKPPGLSDIDAASTPISALTAWQGLFDRAKLQPGERVLVHGGAGAVGVFAIQLARWRGAHVIATASGENTGFVKELGAAEAFDYRATRFEDRAKNIDVVFDTVGGDTLQRSWGVLAPGGRLVTIVSAEEGSQDPRIQQAFFIVEPNQKQLYEIARLLESGRIRTVVDRVVPLEEAPAAYRGTLPRGHRGKVVVAVE